MEGMGSRLEGGPSMSGSPQQSSQVCTRYVLKRGDRGLSCQDANIIPQQDYQAIVLGREAMDIDANADLDKEEVANERPTAILCMISKRECRLGNQKYDLSVRFS